MPVAQKIIKNQRSAQNLYSDQIEYIHKDAARQLKAHIMDSLENTQGVPAEMVLAVLGSLGGYACFYHGAMCVKKAKTKGVYKPLPKEDFSCETNYFGQKIYYGRLIEDVLFQNENSFWGLIWQEGQLLDEANDFDVYQLATYVNDSTQKLRFGQPRIQKKYIGDFPVQFVRRFWPLVLPFLKAVDQNHKIYPSIIALAAGSFMADARSLINPSDSLAILMECAVPMAKMDPLDMPEYHVS